MIKRLALMLITTLLLTACGHTKMTYKPDGDVMWSSWTLWKDVKDAKIIWTGRWGELNANLGSSDGNMGQAEMMEAISCYLTPSLCQ